MRLSRRNSQNVVRREVHSRSGDELLRAPFGPAIVLQPAKSAAMSQPRMPDLTKSKSSHSLCSSISLGEVRQFMMNCALRSSEVRNSTPRAPDLIVCASAPSTLSCCPFPRLKRFGYETCSVRSPVPQPLDGSRLVLRSAATSKGASTSRYHVHSPGEFPTGAARCCAFSYLAAL